MGDTLQYRDTLLVSLLCLLFWYLVASNTFNAFKKTIKSKQLLFEFQFSEQILSSQERRPSLAVKTNKPMACNAMDFSSAMGALPFEMLAVRQIL